MSSPKIVKRYANRKLYDTERSCYVTLDDISSMIKVGDEVRVIDNKSGEDLTSVTLAQIIFETEKKQSFMPLSLLRNLIQQGEAAIEEARERVVGGVTATAEEIKSTAVKIRQGVEGRIGGVIGTSSGRREEGGEDAPSETRATTAKILDLYNSSHRALEDLQRGLEERIKSVGGSVTRYANLDQDMNEIRKRLAELEERIERIAQ